MTLRRYVQLDVFADRPGAGNPLAVVLDAAGLDDAAMQAIARWTRLPETTFVFAPTQPGASYAVRMFSPRREVPFAGHPSVGTAHVVLDAGLAAPVEGLLMQEGAVGVLPLRVDDDGTTRTLAVRTPRAQAVKDAIVRHGGLYLSATGGAGALIARCVKEVRLMAFEDLGTEAVRQLIVENMPLVAAIDSRGGDLFETGPVPWRKAGV